MSCAGCKGNCANCRTGYEQRTHRVPSNPALVASVKGSPLGKLISSVFKNYGATRPTPNNFLRQMKPNVGTYAWIPNTPTVDNRQGPQERGATFQNVGLSGAGAVGSGSSDILPVELMVGRH